MTATLNAVDFAALSPLLILLFGALLILAIESFFDTFAKLISLPLALIAIVAALIAVIYAPESTSPLLTPWLRFDTLARTFNSLFLTIGFGSALLAGAFFQRFEASRGEYYFLLLSSLFGVLLIGSAADFLTLFLGIETLSIALYILCGYVKDWKLSHEAALKYFFMGALATAFFLYGIALVYGAIGTTQFAPLLADYQALSTLQAKVLFMTGRA